MHRFVLVLFFLVMGEEEIVDRNPPHSNTNRRISDQLPIVFNGLDAGIKENKAGFEVLSLDLQKKEKKIKVFI